MDYDALAAELVRALRGSRSQGAINRRLGRSSNVAHAWERGLRRPRASDFFKLARLRRIDVERVLAHFVGDASSFVGGAGFNAQTTGRWLLALARGRSQLELGRALGRDRNTVARWLSGATEPRLPELLHWVELTTHRALDFAGAFADPQALESVRAMFDDLQAQRRVAYELPWAHAVLRVLELAAYTSQPTHVPGFIAARIGISLELEEECLSALAKARQIRRRRGKWTLARVLAVDTRDDPEGNLRLKRHWAQVGLERIAGRALPQGSQYSYNLFAISDEGLEQIREAHLQYFERLRTIVAECKHPTRLALANLQLLPLDV
jgi:transcriptional regulator with XRE-family HTH domain